MREGIAEGAAVFRRRHLRGVLCALTGAGLWGFSGACAQFLRKQRHTQFFQVPTQCLP